MTGKLTDPEKTQLENWIGTGPKTFTLLYSADTHGGCSNTVFHQRCDNQGPTVTVLYNQQGSTYGGYTSVSWNSSSIHVLDDKAFLFQLKFSGNSQYTKFDVKTPSNAIYCHSSYGPAFGAAQDLLTFSGAINKSNNVYSLNGQMNFAYFNNQGVQPANINNGHMTVTELEVYKIAGIKRKKHSITIVNSMIL